MMLNVKTFIHPKDPLPQITGWKMIQSQYDWYCRFGQWTKPKKFLEIGVAAGYSSYAILIGCCGIYPELVTWIDFCDDHGWDGHHDYALGLIRGSFGIIPDDRIINSHLVLEFDDMYDLIHLDGDHTYGGLLQDLRLVSRFLTADGHIICHDTEDPHVRDAIEQFCIDKQGEFLEINVPQVRCGVKILHRSNPHVNDCCILRGIDNVQQLNIKGAK